MNIRWFIAAGLLVLERIRNPEQINIDIYDPAKIATLAQDFEKAIESDPDNKMFITLMDAPHQEQLDALHGLSKEYCKFLVNDPTIIAKDLHELILNFNKMDPANKQKYIENLLRLKKPNEQEDYKKLIKLAEAGLKEAKSQQKDIDSKALAKLTQFDPNNKRKPDVRTAIYNTARSDEETRVLHSIVTRLSNEFVTSRAQQYGNEFYNSLLSGFHISKTDEAAPNNAALVAKKDAHHDHKAPNHDHKAPNNEAKNNKEPPGSTRHTW